MRLGDWHLDTANVHLRATVSSQENSAQCPVCSSLSSRVHSRYQRTLQDLALAQYSLTLQLQVRKFFCLNSTCTRRIFTKRLPQVAAPWARKTVRLVGRLQSIGLALGGGGGARLAAQLGYQACGSTLLNHLKKLGRAAIPHAEASRC